MNTIEKIYSEYIALITFLNKKEEPSFELLVRNNFTKIFIIAIASFFEKEITDLILDYTKKTSNKNKLLINFIKNKAISRQYHSLFQWSENNANSFFGLFGDDFKTFMQKKTTNDAQQENTKAFLELGSLRNRLVHNDYASFIIDKTLEEIFQSFESAQEFLNWLKETFQDFN